MGVWLSSSLSSGSAPYCNSNYIEWEGEGERRGKGEEGGKRG